MGYFKNHENDPVVDGLWKKFEKFRNLASLEDAAQRNEQRKELVKEFLNKDTFTEGKFLKL